MRSRYISLNSQYYFDDEDTVALREQQDAWAHQAFREATLYQAKHVVVLSHVPPFVADEDEQAGWANWKWHHRRALLDAATAAGAKLWLSGHYHGNSVATSRGGIEVVVTSSCGGVINWTLDASLIATQPFPDFSKVHAACIIPTRARERADLPLCRLTPRDLLRRSRRAGGGFTSGRRGRTALGFADCARHGARLHAPMVRARRRAALSGRRLLQPSWLVVGEGPLLGSRGCDGSLRLRFQTPATPV